MSLSFIITLNSDHIQRDGIPFPIDLHYSVTNFCSPIIPPTLIPGCKEVLLLSRTTSNLLNIISSCPNRVWPWKSEVLGKLRGIWDGIVKKSKNSTWRTMEWGGYNLRMKTSTSLLIKYTIIQLNKFINSLLLNK